MVNKIDFTKTKKPKLLGVIVGTGAVFEERNGI
jgi:hypothetical protein